MAIVTVSACAFDDGLAGISYTVDDQANIMESVVVFNQSPNNFSAQVALAATGQVVWSGIVVPDGTHPRGGQIASGTYSLASLNIPVTPVQVGPRTLYQTPYNLSASWPA